MSGRGRAAATARAALRQAAIAADRVVPAGAGVTVLSYHQIGGPRPGSVNLPVGAFDEQMAMLASRDQGRETGRDQGRETGRDPGREMGRETGREMGWDVVTLDQAVATLAAGTRPGANQVVVTFDDGTADFVEHAVPVLVAHAIPATLYLATAFVEEGRSFWDDGSVLSWSGLRDAVATGLVSIGTHTHTHALLDRSGASTARRELETSIALVEERLGVTPAHFAFPKAVAPARGSETDLAVRATVTSAAIAGGRVNRFGSTDLWRLARTPVVAADDLDAFARKVRGGLRLEGEVRERVDRVRYRGADR